MSEPSTSSKLESKPQGAEGVEDEEEEYAEEAEPILAYTRMKNDITQILQQDSVSCIRAGHKVYIYPSISTSI